MKLERKSSLSEKEFLAEYLAAGRPVVITDVMDDWPAKQQWTPDYFDRRFGTEDVQVYNDLFDLENVMTLSDYLNQNFNRPRERDRVGEEPSLPYVRWYSKLRDVDFIWADEIFAKLKGEWNHPYFLPRSSYLLPYCQPPRTVSPVDKLFPGRGIFISGRGARTRLHRDPWASAAVLCQIYGSKKVVMYPPKYEHLLMNDVEVVDIDCPNLDSFLQFPKVKPAYTDTLVSGETLFIPQGWFHHVTTITDSISLTWNFVHESTRDRFLNYLSRDLTDEECQVLRFFLGMPQDVKPEDMLAFLRDRPDS